MFGWAGKTVREPIGRGRTHILLVDLRGLGGRRRDHDTRAALAAHVRAVLPLARETARTGLPLAALGPGVPYFRDLLSAQCHGCTCMRFTQYRGTGGGTATGATTYQYQCQYRHLYLVPTYQTRANFVVRKKKSHSQWQPQPEPRSSRLASSRFKGLAYEFPNIGILTKKGA